MLEVADIIRRHGAADPLRAMVAIPKRDVFIVDLLESIVADRGLPATCPHDRDTCDAPTTAGPRRASRTCAWSCGGGGSGSSCVTRDRGVDDHRRGRGRPWRARGISFGVRLISSLIPSRHAASAVQTPSTHRLCSDSVQPRILSRHRATRILNSLGLKSIPTIFRKTWVRGVEFRSDGSLLHRSSDGSTTHLWPLGR